MATPTELARIAALANALRPEWPVRSVLTYLEQSHTTRAYRDLAVAMAHVACDPQTQTPRRLSEAGPWWQTTAGAAPTTIPTPRQPRCPVEGHEHELAHNCRICRADALAAGDVAPAPALTEAQKARMIHGAATVRAALREPDGRERAAGERTDHD